MDNNNQYGLTIRSILLVSVFFLTLICSTSMAEPLIKVKQGAKAYQHHGTHTTSSRVRPKSSNPHSQYSSHSQHSNHAHIQATAKRPGSNYSSTRQSKAVAKHQLASQQSKARSVTIPKTMHQRATTYHENGMTKQHGTPTLVKTEHLLLSPGGYNPTVGQNNYLQHNQEQQLANINVQAVNWGINLLNKYYPGLGEVTFQPVQQLLATDPLLAKQGANTEKAGFAQNIINGSIIPKFTQFPGKEQVMQEFTHREQEHVGLANLYFSNETNARNCETDMHQYSWDPGGLTGTCAQFSCAKGGMAAYKEYCQTHHCLLDFKGVTKHSCSQRFVQQVKTVCAKNRARCRQESYDAFAYNFIRSAKRKLADVKIGGMSIDFDRLDARVKSLVIDREGNQTQKGVLMFKEALKHHHLTAYSPVCTIAHAFADEAATSRYLKGRNKFIVSKRVKDNIKKIGCK